MLCPQIIYRVKFADLGDNDVRVCRVTPLLLYIQLGQGKLYFNC